MQSVTSNDATPNNKPMVVGTDLGIYAASGFGYQVKYKAAGVDTRGE